MIVPAPMLIKTIKRFNTLLEFWKTLSSVREFKFLAHSKLKEDLGWKRRGKGDVVITKKGSNVLIFNEKGVWKGKDNQDVSFTNTFCWTLERISGVISLEHLRYGKENPVFLIHLSPSALYSLSSIEAHLCDKDAYFCQVHFDRYSLKLTWRVMGPKKNKEIEYRYL